LDRTPVLLESPIMRVTYSLSYETFVGLQPPFKAIEPIGRGLSFFIHFAIVLTGVGFVLFTSSLSLFSFLDSSSLSGPVLLKAIEVSSVGALALAVVWSVRKVSARRARSEQEVFLRDSFNRLHCRHQRFVETSEDDLRFGCPCKTQLRPWSQFMTLAETDKGFVLCTRAEALVIPKDAFASEGERTEFRAVLTQRLTHGKSLAARAIDVTCNREDWRDAQRLQFKLGGWVRSVGFAMLALVDAALILFFVPFFDESGRVSPPQIAGAVCFGFLLIVLNHLLRRNPPRHLLPVKIWLAEDAIYLQSAIAESRIPWDEVSTCVADHKCLLIVQRDHSLILIPQRFVTSEQRRGLLELLRTKVGRRVP
jgi:YcxB-like protein